LGGIVGWVKKKGSRASEVPEGEGNGDRTLAKQEIEHQPEPRLYGTRQCGTSCGPRNEKDKVGVKASTPPFPAS